MASGFSKTKPLKVSNKPPTHGAYQSIIPSPKEMTASSVHANIGAIRKHIDLHSCIQNELDDIMTECVPRLKSMPIQANVTELYDGPARKKTREAMEAELKK